MFAIIITITSSIARQTSMSVFVTFIQWDYPEKSRSELKYFSFMYVVVEMQRVLYLCSTLSLRRIYSVDVR